MSKDSLITRINRRSGFSVIEVVLAGSLFMVIVTVFIGALVYGEESTRLSGERVRAVFLAEEGLEAVRNIKDSGFTNLTLGALGLSTSSSQWIFSGSQDATDIFTRQILITSVNSHTKQAVANVSWQQNPQRSGTVSLTTYFTNWQAPFVTSGRGGVLVYGDGGLTSDAISYRILDAASGTWGSVLTALDVDPATTNRALRAVQVYTSATRNEKVMISRHFNGTAQFIYAQVYSGTSWGNAVLLSSWAATTFLDVQNFSGSYLNNGDFMAVYSDNTAIPKFRVWNGTSWGSQISLLDVGGIPNYVVARARPGTNEVMAAFFDQGRDTNTIYFNGGAYLTSNWTLHSEHSANAPVNTKQLVDFAWSPNNALKGGLVYSDSGTDVSLNIKIWTANGTGGGFWSATANTLNQAARLGALAISGRTGAPEFIACNKDANASPRIICYQSDFTPAWVNPANQILVGAPPGTDTGIQRSYQIAFEPMSGNTAIAIYAENLNAAPKLKQYNAVSTSWDATATDLNTLGGALETVRLIAHPDNDDLMVLLGDTNQDFYSLVWDGANNVFYTAPAGKAFTAQGTSGVADQDFWFDFSWDRF